MTIGLVCAAVAIPLLLLPATSGPPARSASHRTLAATAALCLVAVLLAVTSWSTLAVIIGADACFAVWLLGQARRRRATEARSLEVLEVCEALAAELRAGQPPATALRYVADDWPWVRGVADAAALGGDVSGQLREVSLATGRARLQWVAAAWEVSQSSGSGLAAALGRVARALREDLRMADRVRVELGAARASARLLCLLPLFALGLGQASGLDPLVVFASGIGAILLGIGSALAALGLLWVESFATSVARR